VAGALAAGAPARISDARRTFSEGQYLAGTADLRDRLTSTVDNGRIDNWRVALDGSTTVRCTAPARGPTGSRGSWIARRRRCR